METQRVSTSEPVRECWVTGSAGDRSENVSRDVEPECDERGLSADVEATLLRNLVDVLGIDAAQFLWIDRIQYDPQAEALLVTVWMEPCGPSKTGPSTLLAARSLSTDRAQIRASRQP